MIEKILERFSEKFKYNSEQAEIWREGSDKDAYFREKKDLYLDRANTYGEAIRIVQEVAKDGGWIPCSERLPENDFENVLVWFEYFRYGEYNRPFQTHGISYTFHGEWSGMVNGSSGWRDLRIIAWQPLPAPYQKGE